MFLRSLFGSSKNNIEKKVVDNIRKLPENVSIQLFSFLNPADAATFAVTDKDVYAIPEYKNAYQVYTRRILQHTAKAELKEALDIAKQNPGLLLTKGSLVEEWCGQRRWKSISPFEYAVWAGDHPMAREYIKQFSCDQLVEALRQLRVLKYQGTEHGRHLSPIKKLLDAYDNYSWNFTLYDYRNTALMDKCWGEIARAQINSVVHLLYWICLEENLFPCLHKIESFAGSPPRSLPKIHQYDQKGEFNTFWEPLKLGVDAGLGSTYAFCGGHGMRKTVCKPEYDKRWNYENSDNKCAHKDYYSIKKLYKTRSDDLDSLIQQLECMSYVEDQEMDDESRFKCSIM